MCKKKCVRFIFPGCVIVDLEEVAIISMFLNGHSKYPSIINPSGTEEKLVLAEAIAAFYSQNKLITGSGSDSLESLDNGNDVYHIKQGVLNSQCNFI